MTAREARDNFTDLLGTVYYGKKSVAVEKKGRIFAVVVNPDEYEALKKTAKGRFFEIAREIKAANPKISPDKVMQDATQALEEKRKERYEKGR